MLTLFSIKQALKSFFLAVHALRIRNTLAPTFPPTSLFDAYIRVDLSVISVKNKIISFVELEPGTDHQFSYSKSYTVGTIAMACINLINNESV